MRTIQYIEKLNLADLDRNYVSLLKRQLQESFYHTSSRELDSEGNGLKDRIGKQLDRVTDFLMGN
jgi:hypothetical protein